jgi:hypothetical protein
VLIDFNSRINNLNEQHNSVSANLVLVNNALTSLQQQQISVIKICDSGEHLVRTGTGIYAVYMVSNYFGTYLGKLAEDVVYQTTDSKMARFKLSHNSIICL